MLHLCVVPWKLSNPSYTWIQMKNNSFENESQIYLKETLEHNAMKSPTIVTLTSTLDIKLQHDEASLC